MGSKHSKTSRRGYAASSQHETVRTTATSTNSSANPPADNDPRVDCVPWTAGGDLPVKALPLTENHYSQVDHTLNAAVWDLYMLPQTIDDVTYEQTALQTLKAYAPGDKPPYDIEALRAGIHLHERLWLRLGVRALQALEISLAEAGLLFPEVPCVYEQLSDRKGRGWAPASASAKFEYEQHSDILPEQSDYELVSALWTWFVALTSLYPWNPTPLLFSPEEAFDGGAASSAQPFCALWTSVALASHALGRRAAGPSSWITTAAFAADVVVKCRYSTHAHLAKCLAIRSQVHMAMYAQLPPEIKTPERERGQQRLEKNDRLLGRMVKAKAEALAALAATNVSQPSSAVEMWAHKNCIMDHAGCGCDDQAVVSALEAERAGH